MLGMIRMSLLVQRFERPKMQNVVVWSQQGKVAGVTSKWVCSSVEKGRGWQQVSKWEACA